MNTKYITLPYAFDENIKLTVPIYEIKGFTCAATPLIRIGDKNYPDYLDFVEINIKYGTMKFPISYKTLENIKQILNYRNKLKEC